MHYRNGREAKNGDKVVLLPSYGLPVVGILYDAVAGNGKIALTHQNDPCPNLKECLRLDDVLATLLVEVPGLGFADWDKKTGCYQNVSVNVGT